MRGALERADQFADFDVLLHGDDVGAGDHDVADTALAQPQDVLEHPAFFRREAGFAGRHGVSTSLRSAREFGFQPNSARNTRATQLSPPSRGGGTGTGRWRGS